MSTTKYHYEVYEGGGEDDRSSGFGTLKTVDTYDEAKVYKYDKDQRVNGHTVYSIDKWRKVYSPMKELPIAKTFDEAIKHLEQGFTLWSEISDDPGQYTTYDLKELKELYTEPTSDFDPDKDPYDIFYMDDHTEPVSQRLGECVDGDLDAPSECKVCDKELWKGDTVFIDALGFIDGEGYPEANQDQSYEATCVDCQSRISDAIDDLKEKIAYEIANNL